MSTMVTVSVRAGGASARDSLSATGRELWYHRHIDEQHVSREPDPECVYCQYSADPDPLDQVDLDQLSPVARALAECAAQALADGRLTSQVPVILESRQPVRELVSEQEAAMWYSADQLDRPHRIVWDSWSVVPHDTEQPIQSYFEQQAMKMPIGYYPVGISRVPSADGAAAADWLTRRQVLELLAGRGRQIAASTWRAYVARGEAPQPVSYLDGRTPVWDRAAVEQWAPRQRREEATDA